MYNILILILWCAYNILILILWCARSVQNNILWCLCIGEVKVLLRGASRYLGALSHVLSLLQCISSIIYCFYLLPDSMKTYYLIPRTARNNSIFKFVSSIVYCFNLLSDITKSYYLIPRTARNKCIFKFVDIDLVLNS